MRVRTVVALVLSAVVTPSAAYGDDEDAPPVDADADDASEDADDSSEDTADSDEPEASERPARSKRSKRSKRAPKPADDEPELSTTNTAASELSAAPPRVTFTAELLGASPLDDGNLDLFGVGGGAAVGIDVFVSPWLGVHAAVNAFYLSKDASMSSTSWIAGQIGPRIHFGEKLFGALTHNDAWIDAHVSYGTSGGIRRPGFDAGAAVQWEVAPGIRLGPMLRYQLGSDPIDNNAQLVTIGVAAGFGGRARSTLAAPADDDDDGIVNADDRCRDEPAGDHPHADLPGCPDRDEDGVIDRKDECPREPAGEQPDPDRAGCPLGTEDEDGDEIADADDKCPAQPGPPNRSEPSRHGCPELAKVVDNKIEILQQIFFETDSATIKDESIPVLEAVAAAIKGLDRPRVRIEGHTDDTGTAEYNLDLSKRRARSVAQWLVTSGGVDGAAVETEGYGKSRPLVSGANADTGKNRRVEFIIVRVGGK